MEHRILSIIILLCSITWGACAQSGISFDRRGDKRSGGSGGGYIRNEMQGTTGIMRDMTTLPIVKDKYDDTKLKDLEKNMEERDWGSEDTAWSRACALNTRDAYEKYIAMYPNGAHTAEATRRIIDLDVDDIFKHDHGDLPGMKQVETDDDSPTCVIMIENNTQYILTVFYSGPDSKKVLVGPYGKGSVTLPVGHYKIAASVPPANIRPYAGSGNLSGGRYETGYWIATSR